MSADGQGELTIQYVLATVWRFKSVAFGVFAIFMLAAICYLQLAARYYTVSMSVTAVENTDDSRGSSTLTQGLALLGASPQSDQDNLFSEYQEGLHSTETARALLSQPDLMHRLFSNEWSSETRQWVEPQGIVVSVKKIVRSLLGVPTSPWTQPNAQVVADYLDKAIAIEKDKDNPVVKVSVDTPDPLLGLDLLNAVHRTADDVLRQRALARASSYIDYLNNRQQQASVVDIRQGIADVIVEQERMRMRAESALPFAADLFARPTVSARPTSPSAFTILASSAILGLIFGVFAALLCNRLDWSPWRAIHIRQKNTTRRPPRKKLAREEF